MKSEVKKQTKLKFDVQDHKLLALWVAECAEHVLQYFEKEYPKDYRPRWAIEAVRAWGRGEIKVSEVCRFALAAHAAARAINHAAARAVARAAGHAAATAHVVNHALHAIKYALAAAEAAGVANEHKWQFKYLPITLRNWYSENVEKNRETTLKRPRYPMPDFIREALLKNNMMDFYRARPPYQQNDYIGWINRAVQESTKQKRVNQMIEELKKGDLYMKMVYKPKLRKL